ncbi:Molybdopterin-guanine dinucleotide biosynthesis protein MobA [Paramagnetospirillum magnetotacticum MS-1]|uniref:Molybdenum cofactor guanylyltransferase n=1 Tax=Paramagnetospirillum magnetotacticum MS-1 TaxID=272627 RepID=A0A0C2YG10_PARME|nr:molybdenum cofactor guanylyltransferase MobA [Paramagnetospirillum magnetotacticum]KIL98664.1 Molybdopterin-guanine dinucleotide biosynthesis protein MobA [Paramagnetospirillum magnetotacticum MS-1]
MMSEMVPPPSSNIAGVILAGGLSRRMGGGDKPLITVEGQTLLERVIERLSPQVGPIVLNANGDPARFAETTLPVAPDVLGGFGGPLVGVLTGLEWFRDHTMGVEWMVSCAADTPLFPADLVERLHKAALDQGADIVVAQSGDQAHPVFALWPLRLAADLRRAVVEEDMRKIDAWTARYKVAHVPWPTTPHDPFFNVNTPEDVMRLSMILNGSLPAEPPMTAEVSVAVLIERRDGATQWVKDSWRPLEALALAPQGAPWTMLNRGDSFEHYLATGVTVVLHRSDLASYRYNLAGLEPRLYVVLRQTGEADQPVKVVMATLAPDEAQAMSESGEDMVDGVHLPRALFDWAMSFCACHPPDEPMRKRKRDTLDSGKVFGGKGRS